jgi:hypothetical protein
MAPGDIGRGQVTSWRWPPAQGRRVADLRAEVLVPLELEQFDEPPSSSFVPRRFARRVLTALDSASGWRLTAGERWSG